MAGDIYNDRTPNPKLVAKKEKTMSDPTQPIWTYGLAVSPGL